MPPDIQCVRDVAASAGLRLRAQDLESLSRWMVQRVRALTLPGTEEFAQLLAQDGAAGRRERELLITQFTTGESYFFRDQGQFDLIRQKLLPELIERRAKERMLRIWSAGCAGGEEAYSLAMLVLELATGLAGWNVLILGTDINGEALRKARQGEYREWSFRALDAQRKKRYFVPHGDRWRIGRQLRDMVSFRSLDLVRDRFPDPEAGFERFDLILCRNVFIYLDAHAISGVTAKFAAALADGGYLLTGHNELFGHDTTPLRLHLFPQSAAFQKSARPTPALQLSEALAQLQVQPPAAAALPGMARTPRQPSFVAPPPAPTMPAAAEDGDQLMRAAWRHADRGMTDAAKECCRKAIALGNFDARPYYLLAQLAQERGDTIQAKSLLSKVIYLDPSHVAAYLELGGLHELTGDNARARRMYETARTELLKLPRQSVLAPYAESTVADVLAYVERLLDTPAAQAPDQSSAAARAYLSA